MWCFPGCRAAFIIRHEVTGTEQSLSSWFANPPAQLRYAMIHYPYYSPEDPDAVEEFISGQLMGRLITQDGKGTILIGLYPFVLHEDEIELHLVRGDPQARALADQSRCVFQVDQILSFIPSHWEDPENAQQADSYYRFASCDGSALVVSDLDALADHLNRLLAKNQPEGRHRVVGAGEPLFRAGLERLVLVRIRIHRITSKFKLGQQLTQPQRRHIITMLRRRGEPEDAYTADLVEASLAESSGPG